MEKTVLADVQLPSTGRSVGPRSWLRWFYGNPRVLISGGFVLVLLFVAVTAPLLTHADPNTMQASQRFLSPGSTRAFLGTDQFGRDVLARILYGARLSMAVSVLSVGIALVLGVLIGMVAAFFGFPLDVVLMRLVDAILSFPPILLAIFVVAFLGSSLTNVILVIGVLYVPQFARIAYSSTLSVKENDYILSARAIGSGTSRILLRGVLPNIMAPILVQISLSVGTAILLEAGLSFLGLGPPPNIPSWGRSIEEASRFMGQHPWGVIIPSIVISASVLAFNVLGDALRDRLDPRLRTSQ
ncbi:MAG TPA: ABC transporter permease [Thermomicrobiaceae bacterium]|nr:ABC transporter permease [Thermomicrobiaceae bacterium]